MLDSAKDGLTRFDFVCCCCIQYAMIPWCTMFLKDWDIDHLGATAEILKWILVLKEEQSPLNIQLSELNPSKVRLFSANNCKPVGFRHQAWLCSNIYFHGQTNWKLFQSRPSDQVFCLLWRWIQSRSNTEFNHVWLFSLHFPLLDVLCGVDLTIVSFTGIFERRPDLLDLYTIHKTSSPDV